MKKIKALILGTYRSTGSAFGGIFFGVTVIIWLIAVLVPPAVRTTFLMQSFGFFFFAIFGVTLFIQDQFMGAWILPISGREFVTAKLIQIVALFACGFALFSAILWGMLVFSHSAWSIYVFYIPAALFPVSCTVFMLLLALMLWGKPLILLVLWIIACGTPGLASSLLYPRIADLYRDLLTVRSVLLQHPAGFLIALYLVCAGLTFILYKLGVRNFNKLQYNRFLSVERKR